MYEKIEEQIVDEILNIISAYEKQMGVLTDDEKKELSSILLSRILNTKVIVS